MVRRPPRRLTLLACCLLALAALAAPAVAMPPPEGVCGPCGPGFVDAADEEGVAVTVSHSEAAVDVHANGTATWTVRNRVGDDDAAALAEGDALDRVAARAVDDADPVARLDGGEVVLRYRVDGFATPVAGALRVDHFRQDFAVANYDWLGADRLVLRAPDGYRVAGAPPGATVAGDGSRMTVTAYEAPGTFVTLVPRGPLSGLRGVAAVAATLAPVVAANARRVLLLPTALFGVVVGGAVVALPPLLGRLGGRGGVPGADGSAGGDGEGADVRRLSGRAAALVGALGVAAAVGGAFLARPLGAASLLAAPVAFVAGGYALGRDDATRAYALALWGFVVSATAFFLPSLARRPMGAVAGGLAGVAFALAAVLVAVCCLAVGRWLARSGRLDDAVTA